MAKETSEVERAAARALGEILRSKRIEKALSQEFLAHEAGLNRNYYQQLESGISQRKDRTPANPTFLTLMRLSEVLGVPVGELVDAAVVAARHEAGGTHG